MTVLADLWARITAAIGTASDPSALPWVIGFVVLAAVVIVSTSSRRG